MPARTGERSSVPTCSHADSRGELLTCSLLRHTVQFRQVMQSAVIVLNLTQAAPLWKRALNHHRSCSIIMCPCIRTQGVGGNAAWSVREWCLEFHWTPARSGSWTRMSSGAAEEGIKEMQEGCWVLTISVLYCAHPCMKCSLDISSFLEEISSGNQDYWEKHQQPQMCR